MKNNGLKFVLGSSSRWRKMLLERMGYEFEVLLPGVDEKIIRFSDPKKLTLALAEAKAEELKRHFTEPCVLVTADQVVAHKGIIREKPENPEEAKLFLKSYANDVVETYAAIMVTNLYNGKSAKDIDIAKVYFDFIPEENLDKLMFDKNILSSAGAFTEHPLLDSYMKIVESTHDSVMGLPIKMTQRLIDEVLN